MSTAKCTIFIAPKCATRRRIAPKITARRRTLIAGTGDITDGSGKAASYIRALDMLGLILTRHYPKPIVGGSMWYSFSLADIHAFSRSGDTSFKLPKKASELTVNCAELKAA